MRDVFPKSENGPIGGSSISPPLLPLTPTGSSPPLVPKPPGECSCHAQDFFRKKCTIDHGGQASREFPILLKFEENWVVHDYLHTYLKNSAQKAKKAQQNKDRNLEAVVKGKARGAWSWLYVTLKITPTSILHCVRVVECAEHQRLNTWQGTQECVAKIVKYGVEGNTMNLVGAKTTEKEEGVQEGVRSTQKGGDGEMKETCPKRDKNKENVRHVAG
ncbi:hypothetical protein BJV78DRAFT_1158574 [Lactifluus subvellereus]|nr:hypothetical protein BJV78DRAFT_1158574 [Lactifluus subvellereus]